MRPPSYLCVFASLREFFPSFCKSGWRRSSFVPSVGAGYAELQSGSLPLDMAVPPPFPENIKIVLVDDRPDFRLLIAQYLARRGARVFTAKNAIEGLQLVREIRPEVVLSDINMPGRSGFELLTDIRSLDRENGGRVPVIAVTAYRQEYDVIIGAGFQAYLRKPFTPNQLVAIIDSVLES